MGKYRKNPEIHEASQWMGHSDGKFDLPGVEVYRLSGMSGYSAKLGYIDVTPEKRLTVRPCEYVVKKPDGTVCTMSPDAFESEFVAVKVAKGGKAGNNVSKSEDNVEI